jgi:cytoskeleton protein RodZ
MSMVPEIGETLRAARNRRRIDLVEVEAATKIRVRYLRALENEEWDVLPGGAYARSFVRTYANYLGLDGERLADDFRRKVEDPIGEHYPRVEPAPASQPGGTTAPRAPRLQVSRGALAALISIGLIVLLIGIGLAGGGDDDGGDQPAIGEQDRRNQDRERQRPAAPPGQVSVQLSAVADVWVCMLDAEGTPVINGQILTAGAVEGPFRSRTFTVSFGNGAVDLRVNGAAAEVEDTPNPIGYTISDDGALQELSESDRPTCL